MQPSAEESDRLRASLRRMRLIDADEQPALTLLTGGVSSLIVLAHTRRGPVCVKQALAKLRVAADWYAPVARNRAEVAWMQTARETVPDAVPTVLGEDADGHAFAMAYLPPGPYPVWKAELRAGRIDATAAQAVAQRLAAVHAATADRPALAARFANDADFHALRLAPYLEAAAERHPDCAAALQALVAVTAATRRVLVHGDVSPKNILIGPAGPVLLDAECACYGDPAFDLAFCLNHLLLKSAWQPAWREALLGCYDRLAAAYLAGVRWEAPAELEARAARLLAGLLLARIDGKSPVEYLVDDRRAAERVRRFARAMLQSPVDRLSTLRRRWADEPA